MDDTYEEWEAGRKLGLDEIGCVRCQDTGWVKLVPTELVPDDRGGYCSYRRCISCSKGGEDDEVF